MSDLVDRRLVGPASGVGDHHDDRRDGEQLRLVAAAALTDLLRGLRERTLEPVLTEDGLAILLQHGEQRCVLGLPGGSAQRLSPRELQIARLVAEGATNRAIASLLDISLWTVSTHLRRIFAKLGVVSRAEMVAQLYGPGVRPGPDHAPGRR